VKRCTPLRAAHDSGPRRASDIRLVVVHSTEGGTARSVAEFFHTTAQASTQLVVDDRECYRCVPDLVIPWGAPGVNTSGLHIEHCGYAHYSRHEWMGHLAMLKLSAEHAARWCWQYGIPRRWVSPLGLKLRRKGFTRHMDASAAFTPGGHSDPGPGFPRDTYMELVKAEYAKIRRAAEPQKP
jgi:N-acetylmuramoyl-L-alanine amidase